jgi:hypothetical protein
MTPPRVSAQLNHIHTETAIIRSAVARRDAGRKDWAISRFAAIEVRMG